MKVPLLDPTRGNAPLLEELQAAAERVIKSGRYILGPEVEAFEEACAEYLGCKYAIGVSSGTDALLASLMAFGIGPGDEVICPSFTFFATAGSIARTGAIPVFTDINPWSFTMCAQDILYRITPRTKAIIPVHLFGQSADMDVIVRLANAYGFAIIEDAAQAIGCEYREKKVGTFGIGCFSFFPSKNLGGFGDGGLITTDDSSLADELRSIRNHGAKAAYVHDTVGGNFRIDALQCALLNVKLPYTDKYADKRREHAQTYYDKLNGLTLYELPLPTFGKHVYNQYTIRVYNGQRDAVKDFLQSKGVMSAIYYPIPLHKQQCFLKQGLPLIHMSNPDPKLFCGAPDLPFTDAAAKEVLSIPVASELSTEEIEYVAQCLIEFSEEQNGH